MPRRTPHLGRVTSILCTRFSTQRSTLFHAPQPRSYRLPKTTLSSVAEYAVLAYHTHIRLRLPVCLRHHVAPHSWAPSNILPYPTPQSRHPDGHLAWDLLIRELRFRLTTSHTPNILRVAIYKYKSTLKVYIRKFGSRTYTTKNFAHIIEIVLGYKV